MPVSAEVFVSWFLPSLARAQRLRVLACSIRCWLLGSLSCMHTFVVWQWHLCRALFNFHIPYKGWGPYPHRLCAPCEKC